MHAHRLGNTGIHTERGAHIQAFIHTYCHAYIHTYIRAYIHTHTYIHFSKVHVRTFCGFIVYTFAFCAPVLGRKYQIVKAEGTWGEAMGRKEERGHMKEEL